MKDLTRQRWDALRENSKYKGICLPLWAAIQCEFRAELIAASNVSADDFEALVIRRYVTPLWLLATTGEQAVMEFMTSKQIEKRCGRMYGLDYHEALEMSYDNLREHAIDLQRQIGRLDKALAKMEQMCERHQGGRKP